MKNLKQEWENVTLIKVFEIEVVNKSTLENDWITFDIEIIEDQFHASHVALSKQQDESDKIAFVSWDIDDTFSLDENLQVLHELCANAIIDSEYFNLI